MANPEPTLYPAYAIGAFAWLLQLPLFVVLA